MGCGPAGHPSPAAAAPGALGGSHRTEGPRGDSAGAGRRRAARRAHERRRRRPGRVRRARHRAGADRPPAAAAAGRRPAGQAGHLRPRGRRRAGRRRAGGGRCRPARRLRAVRVHLGGHRHVHPAGRGRPRDRPGGPARAGGRDPDRDGARPAPRVRPWWRHCDQPTPTRSRPSTWSSWWPWPARAASAGSAPGRPAGPWPTSPSRWRPRCRPPRPGCGSAATRTGRSARWPCAGERATTSSRRSGRRAWTPT